MTWIRYNAHATYNANTCRIQNPDDHACSGRKHDIVIK